MGRIHDVLKIAEEERRIKKLGATAARKIDVAALVEKFSNAGGRGRAVTTALQLAADGEDVSEVSEALDTYLTREIFRDAPGCEDCGGVTEHASSCSSLRW